jgi:hypothetical protein
MHKMFSHSTVGFVIGLIPAVIALVIMQLTNQDWVSTWIAVAQIWVSVGLSGLIAFHAPRYLRQCQDVSQASR